MESTAPRWLALDGTANTRIVVPGVLLRSDNLQALSDRDVRTLVDREGLEVVLDLRSEIEVQGEGPGPLTREPEVRIEYLSLHPRAGRTTDVAAPPPRSDPTEPGDWLVQSRVVEAYLRYLTDRPDSLVASIRAIADAEGAVLVHCAAGKDRTGVVVALALDAIGVDRAVIVDDYLATAERIDAIIGRLVSSPTYRSELEGHDPQGHAPLPGTLERVLQRIDDRHGGSAQWLSAHGVTDAELDRLARRLAPAQRLRAA